MSNCSPPSKLKGKEFTDLPINNKQNAAIDAQPLLDLLSGSSPDAPAELQRREQQLKLLQLIVDGLNQQLICVAEGGPGVGKSLAYLLPACLWVIKNQQRIVIATATINLQQQLLLKDLPLVQKMLQSELRVALLKGRANYICRLRLSRYQSASDLFDNNAPQHLRHIRHWVNDRDHDGSRSSLSIRPSSKLWAEICAESDNCHGQLCPFYEQCYVVKARREAQQADLLLVNHHLLFADLALRNEQSLNIEDRAVLPPYQRLIVDEAHNIEANAANFFADTINPNMLRASLRRFSEPNYGLWKRISSHYLDELSSLPPIIKTIQQIEIYVEQLEQASNTILAKRSCFYIGYGEQNDTVNQQLLPILGSLDLSLAELSSQLIIIADQVGCSITNEDLQLSLGEWRRLEQRLALIRRSIQRFSNYSAAKDYACWIERPANSSQLQVGPTNLGQLLQQLLYEPMTSITFVSATLSIDQCFDYWLQRVGLDKLGEQQLLKGIFPSPFDYQAQSQLLIAKDAPTPNSSDSFANYLANCLAQILKISNGRALLLFTSYYALNQVYQALEQRLPSIPLLYQGQEDSNKLLCLFRDNERSTLLATDSFWQGVDVVGPSLSLVVICRLPFRSPEEPWLQLRCQVIKKNGANPFSSYQLPEAVMRFRQGCGRLLRDQQDRGAVVVLDSRLRQKSYGRTFLNSLPPMPVASLTTVQLFKQLQQLQQQGFFGAPD